MNLPKTSPSFDQLDKNTVDARNQLHGAGPVRFLNPQGKGQKVLVIGNSMLLHGINEALGWTRECGMAASAPEKDYVHQLMGLLDDPQICICQVSAWERDYKTGQAQLSRFESARDFGAQVIVMRAIENCPKQDFDGAVFQAQLEKLLDYLNPAGSARVVLTTGFWHHPGDEAIRQFSRDRQLPLVELGDLGERDDMKAIGLFAHKGVANHPGDAGMAAMAERIYKAIKRM